MDTDDTIHSLLNTPTSTDRIPSAFTDRISSATADRIPSARSIDSIHTIIQRTDMIPEDEQPSISPLVIGTIIAGVVTTSAIVYGIARRYTSKHRRDPSRRKQDDDSSKRRQDNTNQYGLILVKLHGGALPKMYGRYIDINTGVISAPEMPVHIPEYITYDMARAEVLRLDNIYDTIPRGVFRMLHPMKHPYFTNAGMKLLELLSMYDRYIPISNTPTSSNSEAPTSSNSEAPTSSTRDTSTSSIRDTPTIRMYDIASAPGMFILAAIHHFTRVGINTPTSTDRVRVTIDWCACSYLDGDERLQDRYGIYEANPERFHNLDITNAAQVEAHVSEGHRQQYALVTGDIGMEHGYKELQEITHYELQRAQALLAIDLCMNGGMCILKMYTIITDRTIALVDTIRQYFTRVIIHKPTTSRITNTESYLICIDRRSQAPAQETCADVLRRYYYTLARIKNTYVNDISKNNTYQRFLSTLYPRFRTPGL